MADRNSKGQWLDGSAGHFKHGLAKTPFNNKFHLLKSRCENPGNNRYKYYGARGIKCEWKSFEEFKDDMHESYIKHVALHGEKDTTIERKDSDGNYSKENCRWATRKEQANNKRTVIIYSIGNKRHSLTEWCRIKNKDYKVAYNRIKRLGWSIEDALTINKNGRYGNT